MKKFIVESRIFTVRVRELLTDDGYRSLQNALLDNPNLGRVIPGCGGLRKLRTEDLRRGKGKRGGCRVIYLHIPEAHRIDMIAIYRKNEQDDLSEAQKKTLRSLAESARDEARISRLGKRKKADG